MNKNINSIFTIIILAIFGSLMVLKFNFYSKALDVPTVNTLKISPDGALNIRLGTKLFKYSSDGLFKEEIDLKQLGITGNLGDFDFFSNGDLLINRDEQLPTLNDKLKSYARIKNTDQKVAMPGRGLQRCNLQNLECYSFSNKIPVLQNVHFIYIDRNNDDVYIADTSRHAVRKLNKSGELLAEIKTGLKYPNQVYLEDEKLWIVDTNHHVMKAVDSSINNFGHIIEQHKTVIDDSRIWPSAFSQNENGWWVNISNGAMEDAKIVMYSHNWEKIGIVKLPENADPIVSVQFNGSMIVADNKQYALYRLNMDGVRGSDFAFNESGDGINSVLKRNKTKNQKYLLWSNITLWVGILLFILLFVYALLQASKEKKETTEDVNDLNKLSQQHILDLAKLPIEGEWIEPNPMIKHIKWIFIIMVVLLITSFVPIVLMFKDDIPLDLVAIFIITPVSFAIGMIPLERLSHYKIGFFKNRIAIETFKGRQISVSYKDIKWNDYAFIVNEWVIPRGYASNSIFPYHKLTKRLMPYVSTKNKIGHKEALILQWNSPEGTLKFVSITMVGMIVLVGILKREEIESFLSLIL